MMPSNQPDVVAGRALNALYFGLMGLFALAFLVWVAGTLRDRPTVLHAAALYDAQCHALSSNSGGTATCPEESAQIVDHYSKRAGNVRAFWLLAQLLDGRRVPIVVSDQGVWNATAVGEEVTIQIWGGKVTAMLINGRIIQTSSNPDARSAGNTTDMGFSSIFLTIGIAGLLLPLLSKKFASARFKRSIVLTMIVLGIPTMLKIVTSTQ